MSDESADRVSATDAAGQGGGIAVVAHAPLASAYAAMAEHVHGELPRVLLAVDVARWQPHEMVAAKVLSIIDRRGWTRMLFLVDLPGASPFHIAKAIAAQSGVRCRILSGLNAGMLLSAIERLYDPDLERLARDVAVRGRRAIRVHPSGIGALG